MNARPRREEHKELTRQAVLGAAAVRFAEQGFSATTIDEIARAARVSKGAVYYHFADKPALFQAVLRDHQQRVLDEVTGAAERRRDPWLRLDAALAAYVEALVADPHLRALLAQAPGALGHERSREIEDELTRPALLSELQAAAATGRLRRPPSELLARVLLSAAREAALSAGAGPEPAAARREAEAVLAAFTSGLRGWPPRADKDGLLPDGLLPRRNDA
ncbi:MAG: TetR/AcrR family transcriptional regulator [Solirubrobacteraceae bacterium]